MDCVVVIVGYSRQSWQECRRIDSDIGQGFSAIAGGVSDIGQRRKWKKSQVFRFNIT